MQHWYLCFFSLRHSVSVSFSSFNPHNPLPTSDLSSSSFASSPSLMSNEEVIWTQLDLTNAIILKWALRLKCNCVISWKCFSSKTKELRVKFTQIAHAGKKKPSGKFAFYISQSTFIPQLWFFRDLVSPAWCFSSVLIFSLLNGPWSHCANYIPREKDEFILERKHMLYVVYLLCARYFAMDFHLGCLINPTKLTTRQENESEAGDWSSGSHNQLAVELWVECGNVLPWFLKDKTNISTSKKWGFIRIRDDNVASAH